MADEKMQNENKKSLNTREDNVAEDIRREAAGKDAEMAADKTTEKEGAPKKKNLAFVVRPQNSKNSSRLQGKRPGQGRQGQNQGRPNGDGKRPAAGQSRSNGEGKPARTEKPTAKSERPVRAAEDRPARPAQNGARSERPQGSRTERTGRPSGEGRQVRSDRPGQKPFGDRRSNGENRGENRGPRQDRDGRGQRSDRGGRDGFQGRDNRDGRENRDGRDGRGQGQRSDRRNDNRRNDRSDATPIVEQQKTQRNKAKDKERDNKKKEYRDEAFEGKGRKGKKQKPAVEVKKPQVKEEKQEEQIKQIVIPEVLTIKELADKMKIVPSVIVKKLFMQGKIVTVNQEVDYETAEEIAMEFDVLCEKEEVVDVIEELLKGMEDELFAAKYDNPDKNIDDCVTYILNWVQKSGCNGFCDDEIYGQAIHYYEEKDIEVGKPLNCQVSVNHHIELTEEEKAQARQEAIRQYQQEQMNKMRNRDTAKRTSQRTDNEVHQPSLFDTL